MLSMLIDRCLKGCIDGRNLKVKLPAHPVRTGQARRASRKGNFILIVPLGPAHPARGGTGHLPARALGS